MERHEHFPWPNRIDHHRYSFPPAERRCDLNPVTEADLQPSGVSGVNLDIRMRQTFIQRRGACCLGGHMNAVVLDIEHVSSRWGWLPKKSLRYVQTSD
jgi:hypothetical protein